MVKKMARHGVKNKAWVSVCIELLERLGQTPEALTGPQEVQDMYRAYAMMSFFFPTDFFESQSGLEYKSHSFLDQTERCKKLPPDRRTHHSNKYMPRKIWSHWDSLPQGYSDDKYPLQWDVAIRPIVARRKSLDQSPSLLGENAGTSIPTIYDFLSKSFPLLWFWRKNSAQLPSVFCGL